MYILCADDIDPAHHTRVTLEGVAEVVEGPIALVGSTKEIADEIAIRYMRPDGSDTQRKRLGNQLAKR